MGHFLSAGLIMLVMAMSGVAQAASIPSHFSDNVEAALTCRSEWSPDYWRSYFRQYLGQPLRVWGEAEWYNAEGAELAGNQIKEAFVNVSESNALMLGVLIETPVSEVRKKIEERLGMIFVELPGPYPRYLSQTGSVLVGLADPEKPKTKWYCARWNLGNRP
ncbi:MAG: hypothetical protein P4L87_09990 [Formivibrio sp.]|nr:hypothetical protein [Formivibrio sp.]